MAAKGAVERIPSLKMKIDFNNKLNKFLSYPGKHILLQVFIQKGLLWRRCTKGLLWRRYTKVVYILLISRLR